MALHQLSPTSAPVVEVAVTCGGLVLEVRDHSLPLYFGHVLTHRTGAVDSIAATASGANIHRSGLRSNRAGT